MISELRYDRQDKNNMLSPDLRCLGNKLSGCQQLFGQTGQKQDNHLSFEEFFYIEHFFLHVHEKHTHKVIM